MKNNRWKQRPKNSTWGDWGPDDQLGRLNLIGPNKVKQAIAEVQFGKSFCLSLPLNYPRGRVLNTVRQPPKLMPVIRNEAAYFNYIWAEYDDRLTDIGSDDVVLLYTQYSTQWDGLAHRGALFDIEGNGVKEPVYYNGYKANVDVVLDSEKNNTSARSLGIENMATHCVQGRGVLVDLFSVYGDFPRKEVGYDDFMRIIDDQKVEIEEGDILCIWTGLDQLIMSMGGKPDISIQKACAVMDGWDSKLLQWISDTGVSAIVADNLAVEGVGKNIPHDYLGSSLPLHEHCLFKLGVHLGELWFLADLAKWLKENGRFSFLLTAPPLRLPGAVGSPVTPVATV